MSIDTELQLLETNISAAYASCVNKGATLPENKNTDNLSATIESISSGSDLTKIGSTVSVQSSEPIAKGARWEGDLNSEYARQNLGTIQTGLVTRTIYCFSSDGGVACTSNSTSRSTKDVYIYNKESGAYERRDVSITGSGTTSINWIINVEGTLIIGISEKNRLCY